MQFLIHFPFAAPEIVDPVAPLSSPVTKTYSRTGVSPAAKQRENDAFDLMVTGASPRIRVDTVTPSEDVELINFDSPKVRRFYACRDLKQSVCCA